MDAAFKKEERLPDIVLLLVTLILIIVGTAMIYSSSSIIALEKFKDGQYFLKKQLVFVVLGLISMMVMTKLPYIYLKKLAYPALALSFVFLLLLFVPSLGMKRGGATRWLNLGGFSFQVTEMVKITMIIFLAHLLTRKACQIKNFARGVLVPLGVTGAVILLVLLQPDFGTAVIIATIFLMMLCIAGAQMKHLLFLVAAFIPIGIALIFYKGYRLTRLLAFLNPWKDPDNTGFQIIQSLISFGSGGAFGVGIGEGMQKLFYLPEPHTDFIISIIAEESGFIGVTIVIIMFALFAYRGFTIAMKAPDFFGTLLAAGLTMVIALEAFINIAGVMGLIPLKGLVLPFLSYGGTAFLMSMTAVGILLNISTQT
ncbi:MAG: putative lipid II flippase FtsW [Smithella sp.]|jgi:cell division protein FtsW|nr:putative lipid II flippase FtsW [Smithella sp.]